jgi:hypothetical protein
MTRHDARLCDHRAAVTYVAEYGAGGDSEPFVCLSCGRRFSHDGVARLNAELQNGGVA